MSEWKEVKITDLVEKICVGFVGPCQKFYCEKESGVPMIRTTNLTERGISFSDVKYISYEFHQKNKKSQLKNGDILVARHGDNGKACMYNSTYEANCLNAVIIRPDSAKINPKFFIYQFNSPRVRGTIESMSSGSVQDVINTKQIAKLNLLVPERNEQDRIASVLSSLDDKIDLLHRQNKTLEAMAETLFRQWFVEGADEGWKEGNLLELIQLVGGGTPKTSNQATNHKSFVNYAEKRITEVGLNNSSAKLLPKYATVISARGTVGKYCLLAETMAFSQSNYGILPNIKNCFFFTYLLINHVVEELQSSAYGSVFDTITTTTFKENKVPIPTETEIVQFEKSISSYFQKMFMNKYQIHTLEKLRGTLLPK
jgi:type I restriction enzyme S subunit